MFRYLFILYLLCVVMTTKAKCAVTRPQEKLLRRSSELPVARPEILPGLVEELQFRSTLPSSTKSAWRQAAEVVLSRTQRNVPYPIEIEMHRVEATADPGITCGACRVWRRYITFYKPTCLPTKIPVRSCRGLCESWEVSSFFKNENIFPISNCYFFTSHDKCYSR